MNKNKIEWILAIFMSSLIIYLMAAVSAKENPKGPTPSPTATVVVPTHTCTATPTATQPPDPKASPTPTPNCGNCTSDYQLTVTCNNCVDDPMFPGTCESGDQSGCNMIACSYREDHYCTDDENPDCCGDIHIYNVSIYCWYDLFGSETCGCRLIFPGFKTIKACAD